MSDIYIRITIERTVLSNNPEQSWNKIVEELYELPFTGFEEDIQLIGYMKQPDFNNTKEQILKFCSVNSLKFNTELIKDQNWNEQWERQYPMVIVDDFCAIVAHFHEPPATCEHLIRITPEMSFGTGHHQTTHMMIQHMRSLDFTQKTVLDYGCGTGILAILAAKLGAATIDAIDYDIWSYRNCIENCSLNNTTQIEVLHGTIEAVNERKYDLILANINKHVLTSTTASMNAILHDGGFLLISGILDEHRDDILTCFEENGFNHVTELKKDDWISILLLKNVKC